MLVDGFAKPIVRELFAASSRFLGLGLELFGFGLFASGLVGSGLVGFGFLSRRDARIRIRRQPRAFGVL